MNGEQSSSMPTQTAKKLGLVVKVVIRTLNKHQNDGFPGAVLKLRNKRFDKRQQRYIVVIVDESDRPISKRITYYLYLDSFI